MKEPKPTFEEILKEIAECSPLADEGLRLSSPPEGIQRYPEAQIATTLNPLVVDHVNERSSIVILGNDGPNVSEPDYPWKVYLKEWLEAGSEISYLMFDPSEATKIILKELSDDFPGMFRAYKILGDRFDRYRTCQHFALFQNPKMLWIEGEHLPETTTASDCSFFPEGVAERSMDYQVVSLLAQRMLQSAEPLFS